MRVHKFLIVLTLTKLVRMCLALPAAASILLPRSEFCANSPKTIAGTFLAGRKLVHRSLKVRGPDTILWCAPHTRTYVIINLIQNVAQTGIMYLLKNAALDVRQRVAQNGDGLIPNGIYMFDWRTGPWDCQFYCANSNNHQQTWAVIDGAIAAVWDYMLSNNNIGTATFTIYDGGNEVGQGTLEAKYT